MRKVTSLRFSHRQAGNCAAIAAHICASLPAGIVSESVMDGDTCKPCQGCDYQCLRGEGECPHQNGAYSDAMNAIMDSDLVYFILPNYCGFPCASYFAFNERSVGFFNGDEAVLNRYLNVPKRFIIVSNTESQTFVEAMQQQVSDEPEILYLKSSNYGKKSICGDILTSEQARTDLDHFLRKDILQHTHYTMQVIPTQQKRGGNVKSRNIPITQSSLTGRNIGMTCSLSCWKPRMPLAGSPD